jgi:adenylyltransferase/sulfurtransferase
VSDVSKLTNDEMRRYARHVIMPEVGLEGQERLKAARVLCVGAGGLGSPLLLYLAAAGVGTIGIVDFDVVDESNLQRQVIHSTDNLGRSKIDSAAARVAAINPFVTVKTFNEKLTSENALRIFSDFDLVADGTDNFATRYLVNDACVLTGKLNIYASVFRFEGQATVFGAKDGPCYRCLYPEPPPPGMVPSCAEGGVLGILPGLLGLIQATETIKLIAGLGDSLVGRLLLVDALAMHFRELRIKKDPDCPACGKNPTLTGLIDYEQFCGVRGETPAIPQIEPAELKRRLDAGEEIVVLDVREPHEYQIANIGGRLVPLRELPKKLDGLERDGEIVVHCKTGGRSAKACEVLLNAGFKRVSNLAGGIDAWAQKVDPTLTRY